MRDFDVAKKEVKKVQSLKIVLDTLLGSQHEKSVVTRRRQPLGDKETERLTLGAMSGLVDSPIEGREEK